MTTDVPIGVRSFAEALADWLTSFTVPASLAAEMADACAQGAEWVSAIAGLSSRRAGWGDTEALAWGISAGAQAGAFAAATRSVADGAGASRSSGDSANGPAHTLLAADALVAAAHEALSSLPPSRLTTVSRALDDEFGDGGLWMKIGEGEAVRWSALIPLALAPAASTQPDGPWTAYAESWRKASAQGDERWDQPGADPATRALMRAADAAAPTGAYDG